MLTPEPGRGVPDVAAIADPQRDAAGYRLVRDDEILGPDAQDAGFANAGIIGQLRFQFVRAQRHQVHRRRADEGGDVLRDAAPLEREQLDVRLLIAEPVLDCALNLL